MALEAVISVVAAQAEVGNHISDITVSALIKVLTVFSFHVIIAPGQHPSIDKLRHIKDSIIITVVRGAANIFVIRKYLGNVPKRTHASGAVNI